MEVGMDVGMELGVDDCASATAGNDRLATSRRAAAGDRNAVRTRDGTIEWDMSAVGMAARWVALGQRPMAYGRNLRGAGELRTNRRATAGRGEFRTGIPATTFEPEPL